MFFAYIVVSMAVGEGAGLNRKGSSRFNSVGFFPPLLRQVGEWENSNTARGYEQASL